MTHEPRTAASVGPFGGVPTTTNVAIIEDRREIREGLQMLINGTDTYRCTGTYRSMEDALSGIGSEVPDVALVDIGLPGMSGIEGITVLKRVIQTCCCSCSRSTTMTSGSSMRCARAPAGICSSGRPPLASSST